MTTSFRVRRTWGTRGEGFLSGGWRAMDMVSMGISHLLCGELRGQSSLPFLWKEWQGRSRVSDWGDQRVQDLGISSGGRRWGQEARNRQGGWVYISAGAHGGGEHTGRGVEVDAGLSTWLRWAKGLAAPQDSR